jgi:general nucleoside transport system ATP-binding protein
VPSRDGTAIMVDGNAVGQLGPEQRRACGMAFVPEERLGHGAVPNFSLAENVLLSATGTQRLAPSGFIRKHQVADYANRIIAAFGVKTTGSNRAARTLSGGNLQKFIVGREILQNPGVLIAAQPTWGVDAGAAAQIHEQLLALAAKGAAILVMSQDLDELLQIADRIAVLSQGRLSPARSSRTLTVESIGLAMGGAQSMATQTGDMPHAAA